MRWFAFAAACAWGMLPVWAQEPEPQPTLAEDVQSFIPGPVAVVPQPGPAGDGQTLPSAQYLQDDIRYFPGGTVPAPQSSSFVDPSPALSVRVYSVADLVIQPAPAAPPHDAAEALRSETSPYPAVQRHATVSVQQRAVENLAELAVILQSVTTPESWDSTGGPGHVTIHGNTFSLIVRQTDAVHEEIADLLAQLRRLQDTEIELTLRFFQLTDEIVDDRTAKLERLLASSMKPLSGDDLTHTLETLQGTEIPIPLPRTVIPNGGSAGGMQFMHFNVTAVAAADNRSIRLQFGPHAGAERLVPRSFQCRIPDGSGVIVPLIVNDEVMLVLATATIVVHEEEEELLSLSQPSANTLQRQVGTVNPRIIIEEEEELLGIATPTTAAAQKNPDWEEIRVLRLQRGSLIESVRYGEGLVLDERVSPETLSKAEAERIPVVYQVADLLLLIKDRTPRQGGVNLNAMTGVELNSRMETWLDFDQLTRLITTSIAPESWRAGATITPHTSTMSLVIRQTQPVHAQIADYLAGLRRIQQVLHPEAFTRPAASEVIQTSAVTDVEPAPAEPARLFESPPATGVR